MRQKLGQHFLTDPAVPDAMAAALSPESGETIIEIGAGHGELTQAIVAAIEAGGTTTKIVAVEKDPVLAAWMRQRFQNNLFVEVIEADIRDFFETPAGQMATAGRYKLAGNLPYYLTGYLLRLVGELEQKPELAVCMVQKEVAERMAAQPPHMNRLAASVQFWARVEILLEVPRSAFDPPPEVDSAVILLHGQPGRATKNDKEFYEMVRAMFAQPRKTAFNNLRDATKELGLKGENPRKLLEECNVDLSARPQNLSLSDIERLAHQVAKMKS